MTIGLTNARARVTAVAACTVLMLAGCGTRADDAQIQAGAGGGPVALPQSALDELRAATGAAAGTGTTGATVPGAATTATTPGGTGTVPGAGTTPTTTGAATTGKAGGGGAAAGAGTAGTASTPATCTAAGAPVDIGQVGTFSGITGPAWTGGRTAVSVWVKDLNARGGLACHPVVLHFADDGGDPARASALVQEQVKSNHVIAFVGGHDDLSISGFKQAIETTKVPAVGGDLVAQEWYSSPYMFPQGAGIEDQLWGLIKANVDQGKTKLGLLYCVEVAACTYADKLIDKGTLAKEAGATVVYNSAISLTQTDFTAQCQSAKNAGVDQLALGMDGTAMARVARSCLAVGFQPLFGTLGGVISPSQAEDTNLSKFSLATATGTAPWTVFDTPGSKAYKAALEQYAPGEPTSGSSILLWTAGKLLEAAVAKLGAPAPDKALTADMVVSGLRQLKKETLGGLTGPLTFGSGIPVSSKCVFFELHTATGWSASHGSKATCRP